ncbi:hypothetical protein [Microcystis phage Mwe-JY05]
MLVLHLGSGTSVGYELDGATCDDVVGALRTYWFDPQNVVGRAELYLTDGRGGRAWVPCSSVIGVEIEPDRPARSEDEPGGSDDGA